MVNLERHVRNVQEVYGLPCVVSINQFVSDTQAEIDLLTERVNSLGVDVVLASHWADGGKGAEELARKVVELCERPSAMTFVYEDDASLWDKITAIATRSRHRATATSRYASPRPSTRSRPIRSFAGRLRGTA
jgi:formate--tetrahydrofolate ligase